MANWLTYRIRVGDDVLVLADEEAQELIKNETERSKKADAQTASFLESTTTNGIIRNSKSDPFGQTAIGGMKVVIDKGDLIINGNIKNHTRLTRTYNVTQENRTEVFLYRYDSVTNEITGLWRDCIIQGDIILSREDKTELPLRSSGYYDILICKITIPAGATEITQDMIGDFRQNEYYCGYAKNILVEIDETLTKSDAAADAAAVGTVISDLRNETRTRDIITEKRITNLEAGLPAERWSVDASVAYVKDVPENALPFASVDMVGGMTRKCTNFITYPYSETTKTGNGITFTDNGDGTITINGTATADISFSFGKKSQVTPKKTYFYKVVPNRGGLGSIYAYIYTDTDDEAFDFGSGVQFTPNGDVASATVVVKKGQTFNNSIVKPMLNEGTEPLPYEPYFAGLRSAPVTEVESVGVNLISYPYYFTDGSYNGLTFTINSDRSIKINGTAEGAQGIALCEFANPKTIKSGNYYAYLGGKLPEGCSMYSAYQGKQQFWCQAQTQQEIRTLSQDISVSSIRLWFDAGAVFDNVTIRPMLVKSDVEVPYIPYRRNTLPIPAEVQVLDGFGWGVNDKVYNYIDWENKRFVKRVGRVDMGTTILTYDKNFSLFVIELPEAAKPRTVNTLSSVYIATNNTDLSKLSNLTFNVASNGAVIYIKDLTYTDAATFKAAVSGVMLYYELAEPVITDISDLLPDDNLIRVEGGCNVTMVNEYGYDVPSEITYQLKGAEA